MPRLRKPSDWPRYMEVKKLADGSSAYFWHLPTWAKKRGCTQQSEPLGKDYGKSIERAEFLNQYLDAWRKGDQLKEGPTKGTLIWLFEEFRKHRKFERLAKRTKKDYLIGFDLVGNLEPRKLPQYKRIGYLPLNKVTPAVADIIYERLSKRADGNLRITTANKAMRAVRRAWNVVYRQHPLIVPSQNPFSSMDLQNTAKTTKQATREQLLQFVQTADELGYPSMGTAAFISFEWLLREIDIIGQFSWSDYRFSERQDAVRIRHGKTDRSIILPLEDEDGLLYPELLSRIDALPRHGSLVIMRDRIDKRRGEFLPYTESWFQHLAAKIRDHAGLPKEITFASFRHGGLTELGDADLTDQNMMALSAHKTRAMLTVYSKRNERQRIQAARIRLSYRQKYRSKGTNKGEMSE